MKRLRGSFDESASLFTFFTLFHLQIDLRTLAVWNSNNNNNKMCISSTSLLRQWIVLHAMRTFFMQRMYPIRPNTFRAYRRDVHKNIMNLIASNTISNMFSISLRMVIVLEWAMCCHMLFWDFIGKKTSAIKYAFTFILFLWRVAVAVFCLALSQLGRDFHGFQRIKDLLVTPDWSQGHYHYQVTIAPEIYFISQGWQVI